VSDVIHRTEADTAASSSLQTVSRAARVLLAFREKETWTVSSCARKLDVSKSMAHRLLATLAEERLVAFDPQVKAYRLGPAIFELYRAAVEGPGVVDVVGPLVREAAERTSETITFCKIHGMKGVCVDFADSPHAMRMTVRRGEEYALNAGAIGKCLLAYQPPEFLDALAASGNISGYTENTILDPSRLRAELETIRAQGVAFSKSEITPGASSLGVPIIEADGKVDYCLAASGPTQRFDEKKAEIAEILISIADMISKLLNSGRDASPISGGR